MTRHEDDRAAAQTHDHGQPADGRRSPSFPPVRWVDVAASPPSADGAAVERRIGTLFAKIPAPSAFDAAAQARVGVRLRPADRRPDAAGTSWVRRRLVVGLALGAVVLMLSGAVIAGGGVRVWWNRLRPAPEASPAARPEARTQWRSRSTAGGPRGDVGRGDAKDVADSERPLPAQAPPGPIAPLAQPEPPSNRADARGSAPPPEDKLAAAPALPRPLPRPHRRVLTSRQAGREEPLAVAPPVDATLPAESAPAVQAPPAVRETGASSAAVEPLLPPPSSSWMPAPDPAPRPARGAPTTTLPSAAPSQLSQEARLLNVAMVQLRQRRDGAGALATLNEYLARYPRGILAGEARGARIDALLLLQRKNEALRALEAAHLEPVGRGQELLVIRGELRARRDCADAIRDFDQVLGGTAPATLQERALFGRAVCRGRLGNEDGARADADAYLQRFPAGRFAASVRRLAGAR